ncbi:MAG: HD domain-containing protein [Lachnospiraceae bacterium]|nr:HD domain-containing protein [Lachnospiraceae bacterium]
MKYISDYKEGDRVSGIYLCKHKQAAVTKNGKPYENLILQDKTGSVEGKIWDPNSAGIAEYEKLQYVEIGGDVNVFQGAIQFNIKRLRPAAEGEYDPKDYLPVSKKDRDKMFFELKGLIGSITSSGIKQLLEAFFIEDEAFVRAFCFSSAAKSVHHSFVGGLLEHTLSVTKLCDYYCSAYPALNRDLLLAAAMLHDIGKIREITAFPENDYSDEGNLLGHIVMGVEMISEKAGSIENLSPVTLNELKHCILAHHGEFEFGSPKKPALMEAMALHMADNTDAKMETFTELFEQTAETGWLGFNRILDSNIRATGRSL